MSVTILAKEKLVYLLLTLMVRFIDLDLAGLELKFAGPLLLPMSTAAQVKQRMLA